MKKVFLLTIVILSLLFMAIPGFAQENEMIIKDTITVTSDGGRYQVGFVNIEFKKNFIEKGMEPITFEVEIYAENEQVYIEFSPDIEKFSKSVHIRTDEFKGSLYDKAADKNIIVKVKKQHIVAPHFSRYCLY